MVLVIAINIFTHVVDTGWNCNFPLFAKNASIFWKYKLLICIHKSSLKNVIDLENMNTRMLLRNTADKKVGRQKSVVKKTLAFYDTRRSVIVDVVT